MAVYYNGSKNTSGLSEGLISSLREEVKAHERLDGLATFMGAAGNDTRMRILYLLWRNYEIRVNDLADILCITTPAVSQQLKKLRERRMVRTRRDAQTVYYRLNVDVAYINDLVHLFERLSEMRVAS